MEQIETQVSDLRYLTSTPGERRVAGLPPLPVVASPVSVVSGENQLSPAFAHPNSVDGAGAGGTKRKADEDGNGEKTTKAQRSKRNRYISIACNECKRRKIKCNGESPCQRCGNLNLQCLYAPNCCSNSFKESDEFRAMTDKVSRLQEQVESLFQNLSALRNDTLPARMPPPPQDRALPLVSPPGYPPTVSPSPVLSHGSTFRPELAHPKRPAPPGSAFLSDGPAAPNSVGYHRGVAASTNDSASPGGFPDDPHLRHAPTASQDPLWDVPQDEMLRLCRVHEEELGILLPVVDMQTVTSHAQSLASFMEGGRRGAVLPSLNDERTLLLKAVMCCALAAEDRGNSDRAGRLFESMEDEVNRKLMAEAPAVTGLSVLSLVAGYRFLSNDEVLAWRVMGQVARMCLEMGIHRRSGLLMIDNEGERQAALTSFWFAYVFDRRWSLGTGMPWVIQDEEIEQVPLPDGHPYLHAMIAFSRLGARVSRLASRFGGSTPRDMPYVEVEGLDKEIIQWYENTPEEVKVRDWAKEKRMVSTPSYNLQRLRIWTYLRFNQLRIWLYAPFLHSTTSIMSNFPQAQTAAHLAADTLRYLTHLNATTPLYRKLPVFYHQFLPSSVAAAFLASAHSPQHLAPLCRDEFLAALELVRDLSAKSHVSRRLWRSFSALGEGAPPGAGARASETGSLVGGSISGNGGYGGGVGGVGGARGAYARPTIRSAPVRGVAEAAPSQSANGVQLQAEMRRVFEMFVTGGVKSDALPALDAMGRYVDGSLYGHFRDMF